MKVNFNSSVNETQIKSNQAPQSSELEHSLFDNATNQANNDNNVICLSLDCLDNLQSDQEELAREMQEEYLPQIINDDGSINQEALGGFFESGEISALDMPLLFPENTDTTWERHERYTVNMDDGTTIYASNGYAILGHEDPSLTITMPNGDKTTYTYAEDYEK